MVIPVVTVTLVMTAVLAVTVVPVVTVKAYQNVRVFVQKHPHMKPVSKKPVSKMKTPKETSKPLTMSFLVVAVTLRLTVLPSGR
jgi:hypothetical protein